MGVRKFQGKGAGLGLWLGCGFGAGAAAARSRSGCRAAAAAAARLLHLVLGSASPRPPARLLSTAPTGLSSLAAAARAGWGFGGAPLGVAGLSAGGMCGVVAGLGWGVGVGLGTQYINVSPEFTEGKQHRCAGWSMRCGGGGGRHRRWRVAVGAGGGGGSAGSSTRAHCRCRAGGRSSAAVPARPRRSCGLPPSAPSTSGAGWCPADLPPAPRAPPPATLI